MKLRKVMAVALTGAMAVSAFAGSAAAEEATEITLWTYPIGSWGDAATVDGLLANFNEAHPDIKVKVEYLDYTNGDDKINTASRSQLGCKGADG